MVHIFVKLKKRPADVIYFKTIFTVIISVQFAMEPVYWSTNSYVLNRILYMFSIILVPVSFFL